MAPLDYAVSSTWPAPNPALAAALIGSVLAAQGFVPAIDRHASKPWAEGEWNRVAPWLAPALKDGSIPLDEVREGVRRGWFYLLANDVAAMVAELQLTPRVRALHVFAAGGSLDGMADLTRRFESVAQSAGVNVTGATGRKGWVRWLKRFGYAPSSQASVEKVIA